MTSYIMKKNFAIVTKIMVAVLHQKVDLILFDNTSFILVKYMTSRYCKFARLIII